MNTRQLAGLHHLLSSYLKQIAFKHASQEGGMFDQGLQGQADVGSYLAGYNWEPAVACEWLHKLKR